MGVLRKAQKKAKTLISTTTARVYDIVVISALISCGFIAFYLIPCHWRVYSNIMANLNKYGRKLPPFVRLR